MGKAQKFGLVTSLALVAVGIILLLNITARNPTNRRYSSAPVLSAGSSVAIGLSGERIIAIDLRIPRNEDPDQRQCICNSPASVSVSQCRTCVAYSQSIARFRRPDFVTPRYIGEVKNRTDLLYTSTDLLNQIGDYAIAARAMGVPLWVYVRVDTEIDDEYRRIVRSTGGDILPYLKTSPGYRDTLDLVGIYLIGFGGAGMVFFMGWHYIPSRPKKPRPPAWPPKKRSPKPAPDDPMTRAARSVENVETFTNQSKDSSRRKIDQGDAREDMSRTDDSPDE